MSDDKIDVILDATDQFKEEFDRQSLYKLSTSLRADSNHLYNVIVRFDDVCSL